MATTGVQLDTTLVKQSESLAQLFNTIIKDAKHIYPAWDELSSRAAKLASHLNITSTLLNAFLDSLQNVADSASNNHGGTRDIGTALTRVCLRHRTLESKCAQLSTTLTTQFANPLAANVNDWKNEMGAMNKMHERLCGRARVAVEKRHMETRKLQRKMSKSNQSTGGGDNGVQSMITDVNERRRQLVDNERVMLRNVMLLQRKQYGAFVNWLRPVLDVELSMMQEAAQVNEVLEQLTSATVGPSEQATAVVEAIINDVTQSDSMWSSMGQRQASFSSLISSTTTDFSNNRLSSMDHGDIYSMAQSEYGGTQTDLYQQNQQDLYEQNQQPTQLRLQQHNKSSDGDEMASSSGSVSLPQSASTPSPTIHDYPTTTPGMPRPQTLGLNTSAQSTATTTTFDTTLTHEAANSFLPPRQPSVNAGSFAHPVQPQSLPTSAQKVNYRAQQTLVNVQLTPNLRAGSAQGQYGTVRVRRNQGNTPARRPMSYADAEDTTSHPSSSPYHQHRQSIRGNAPPPPIRRNSTITAATPTAPSVEFVRKQRSRCTTPIDNTDGATSYASLIGGRLTYQQQYEQQIGGNSNNERPTFDLYTETVQMHIRNQQ